MDKLKNIKEITKDGSYKYRGFLLKKDAVFGGIGEFEKVEENSNEKVEIEEIKEIGEQYSFFNDKNNDFFFIINTKINGVTFNVPLGEFQKKSGSFNASHNITIENGFYFFDKPVEEIVEK